MLSLYLFKVMTLCTFKIHITLFLLNIYSIRIAFLHVYFYNIYCILYNNYLFSVGAILLLIIPITNEASGTFN